MSGRRLTVAAVAILLHASLMVGLIVAGASSPWWVVAQAFATVATLGVMAWAVSLIRRPAAGMR